MLYRVLAFALLCGAPIAASGATVTAVGVAPQADLFSFASRSAEPAFPGVDASTVPNPLDPRGGDLMWDPLGEGCIDAADPAAWLPGGARDPAAGVICLPQPCARLLTEEEMVRDVLGRPLREGEWETYLARYAETCSTGVMSEGEGPGPGFGGRYSAHRAIGGILGPGAHQGIVALARAGGPQTDPFTAPPSTGRFEPGGRPGEGEGPWPADPPAGNQTGGRPGEGEGPWPADPPAGNETGGAQPAPVPLPGSFLLLMVAVAALRLPRR